MTSIDPTTTGTVPATDPGTAAPRISVRLFAGAAAEFGADAVSLQASTLGEAIEALQVDASAAAARVIDRSSFLLNAVACTDREQSLADGDRLDVLPPFAGG
ncbi:molybdopterin synthase sulfur carrier subunit [Brachybacterium avium]|uniref:Molybdopterin synthase sulfur carrier subunit n=1 Tax=Brachybacterium avium TaxID=2017485 RepID=A0A220UEX8_9MICO|nr:MoaD/ThiS family protein [Brachybacterium avium]ASK66466.1 molybdopterin synthase sulfur carrier subunit [Brachybacterium avium]